jgi:hypothetical protein
MAQRVALFTAISVPPPVQTPPRLLNIDDDPEGYFSTSPLAPTDHSVIFASLSEAGHKIIGNTGKFTLINGIHQIAEPVIFVPLFGAIFDGFPI